MATAAELTVAEELVPLREIAVSRGWNLKELDPLHFHIALPAKDKTVFYLFVDCENYKAQPPPGTGVMLEARSQTAQRIGLKGQDSCTRTVSFARLGIG